MGVLLDDIKAAKENLSTSSDTITTAHTTFTHQFTSFLVLAEQLEKKAKELEEREIAVGKLEKGAKVLVQQIEEREKKCKEREKEVEMREITLTSKMAMWNETEKQMEENAAKLPNVVRFNVSGKQFAIEKEKLLKHKGSYFEQMMTTNHPPLIPSTGPFKEMFINRDPKLFNFIFRFLAHGQLILPANSVEVELLSAEFEYFKLPFTVQNPIKPAQLPDDQTGVHLNVSGTRFTVAKEKILQFKGSLLETKLTNNPSPLDEIFLARDPRLFKRILQYIVHGRLMLPLKVDLKLLRNEFEYFRIPFKSSIQSALLVGTTFADNLTAWLPDKELRLLYKALEHGFGASEFHKLCDNKGPTLTLIRSKEGYLFGGYSVLPWDSTTNNYKQHPEGFIFTLSNPHNIPPTKYPRNGQNANSIYCYESYGPSFNNDILVASNSNQNKDSYTCIGGSYVDLTGKGYLTFTGASNFTTSDVEVFAVI